MSAKKTAGDVVAKELADRFGTAYDEALTDLGKFNLAIFGKTGAGKSTLINAIFSQSVAKTGTGRPVTLKTEYFEHPSGFFGVYDSEGIEVGEEGDKILARFRELIAEKRKQPVSEQIHVIWYCVRGGDLRFEDGQAEFIDALAAAGLPVIFVLTQVERRDGKTHPKVIELQESIVERGMPLAPTNRVFLTMAEGDEFSGLEAHGLDELLAATFRVAPDSVRKAITAAQKLDLDSKAEESRKVIAVAATSAAAAGASPIPFSDAAILVPIQLGMMARISALFGLEMDKSVLAKVATTALTAGGTTAAGKYLVTNLMKFVPGGNIAAGVVRAGVASSLTYAVGEAWIAVNRTVYRLDPDVVRAMPADEISDIFLAEFKKRAKVQKATD